MKPAEQSAKLLLICRLTAEELRGWHHYCRTARDAFPGEVAALMARARALGMTEIPDAPDLMKKEM